MGPETPRRRRFHERLGAYDNERISGSIPPEEQLRQLTECNPTILWFYPTVLRALFRAADYRLRDHIRPRLLITSSEMFDNLLREQVLADLGLNPYSAYGANEVGRIAIECPAREGLHINTDHVVIESWVDGRAAKPGEEGAALVTTLDTRGMPLVRYRLGDRIRLLAKPCSCGSPLPLMGLSAGREGELIVLPSGRVISAFSVANILREYLDIMHFRILQEAPDRLELQLVTLTPWPLERLREVQQRALERIGEPVTVKFRLVDELPFEGPKFRYFVSHFTPEADSGP